MEEITNGEQQKQDDGKRFQLLVSEAETMEELHIYGQKKAMAENGWTADDFRREFGKNYL